MAELEELARRNRLPIPPAAKSDRDSNSEVR